MVIEPRRAAPGALRRWCWQAVGLIARGAGVWLGFIVLLCLAIFAGQRLPLVSGILALLGFFASVLAAARLDASGPVGMGDILAALRQHGRELVAFPLVIATVGALVWVLFLARPGVPWWNVLYTERNVVVALSADGFMALRQVFVYSGYALGLLFFGLNIPGLTAFLQFPCTTLLGMPFRTAYRAGAAAQMKNLGPMLGVGFLFILLPVVAVLLLPPLVPVLYCFLGALAYVAFREIFLGVGENRVREPRRLVPAHRPAPVRSPGSP
ncbi:MAG: hypothetical protein J0M16_01715 [Gammaproteobacteria bacterium]|nr:hypothetical protein [Gammaproteobacteria bacterium]